MKCPRDGKTLKNSILNEKYQVETCPQCHGFWLDEGELEALEKSNKLNFHQDFHDPKIRKKYEAARASLAALKNTEKISCPLCPQKLEQVGFMKSTRYLLDICPHCKGIWLDGGELEMLQVSFEGDEALSNFYKEKRENEKKRGTKGNPLGSFWNTLKDIF